MVFTWRESLCLGVIKYLKDPELVRYFACIANKEREKYVESESRKFHCSLRLTREEKIEYNDLMIRNLKGCQEDYRGQIYLHNFQRERNYPDEELYKDFSHYQYPHWDNVVQMNKEIKDLELKNYKLKIQRSTYE